MLTVISVYNIEASSISEEFFYKFKMARMIDRNFSQPLRSYDRLEKGNQTLCSVYFAHRSIKYCKMPRAVG